MSLLERKWTDRRWVGDDKRGDDDDASRSPAAQLILSDMIRHSQEEWKRRKEEGERGGEDLDRRASLWMVRRKVRLRGIKRSLEEEAKR